ncbi:hypothetical protein GJ744_006887 [Endocarpon pusillum]|uniref:Rhodopsin domain-containing protein n=1 Tax=Endocarpon pusillum TaxID=364733 RepID=A0A8H7DYA1_9EURO|nr:hypothetical protein GJ744_006887 [Endocarpon pusillum]
MLIEDYFSVLSWLSFLAYIGLAIVIGRNGGDITHVAYLSRIESLIYDPIIVFVKISILLQYITLFVSHRGNVFHYAVHILLWTNVVFYTIITFLYILQCTPWQRQWNPALPAHCRNNHQAGVMSGGVNALSDLLILILPLPIIWRLHMAPKKKLRLLAVFGLGSFACVASVVRLIYSIRSIDNTPGNATYQLDVNRMGLWAFAEIAVGIIVGCVPTLPKFFKHLSSNKPALPSSFKALSSTSRQAPWRRFFRWFKTSDMSTNKTASFSQNIFNQKTSGSKTPRIETLDLTRISFSFG